MNYMVVILVTLLCTIVTLFLIKESFTFKKRVIFNILLGISIILILFFSIYGIYYDFKNRENILKNNNISLQDEIDYLKENETNLKQEIERLQGELFYDFNNPQFSVANHNVIIFNKLCSNIISKNFNDTKIINSSNEFVFYNHPEKANEQNTLTFSFSLNQEYTFFSTCINIKDNIDTIETPATSIQIFIDENLIYDSKNLYNFSLPLYIDLNLNDTSMLYFSISTTMINTENEFYRTVSFSDINIG